MTSDSNLFHFQDMLESVSNLLQHSNIEVHARSEWGSQNTGHRDLIRQMMSELDKSSTYKYSISHTTGMGVLVYSLDWVGVDVEVTDRVTNQVMQRVSTLAEIQEAPTLAALWCAKEAAFKALKGFRQPSVISDVSIGGWKKIDSQTETFQLLNYENHETPHSGRGVVKYLGQHTYAFFLIAS